MRFVKGDRVRFTARGTPWEEDDDFDEYEGMWGTVTLGDDRSAKQMSVLAIKWDKDAPGMVSRELVQAEYVIGEEPS